MEIVSSQLDYSKVLSSHPVYSYNRILPLSGSQSTTLTASGGNETVFELPTKVYNFARSRLEFTLAIPKVDIAVPAANTYTWVFKDAVSPIRQMQLYTRAGLYLCDIPYFNNYTKLVRKPFTPLKDFLEFDIMHNSANGVATPIGRNSSTGSFLQRNNDLRTAANAAALTGANDVAPSSISKRYDNSNASLSYTEAQYLDASTDNNAGNTPNPAMFYRVSIPFKEIKNCIFALDKDLYFGGEILILRIVWDTLNKVCYQVTNAGGNVNPVAAAGTLLVPGTAINIDAMTFYLAIEKDPAIVTDIINAAATDQGLSVLCDYIFPYKFNVGPSTNPSVTLRFNRGHGRKLKFIIAGVFNNVEQVSTAYDCSNVGISAAGDFYAIGTKITQFYTLLNNNRLQEYDLIAANGDDYKYIRDYIKESVLQNQNIYAYNWCFIENFCGEKTTEVHPNLDCGIPLDIEQKWDIYYTTPNLTLNHYLFGVVQRLLRINKDGITMI